MVAQGEELGQTLVRLCCDVERLLPGIIASVLSVDDEGRLHPLAAPSLPPDYTAALDGLPIGPHVGSCGSAVYLERTVIVADIEHDERWRLYRDLALSHGLRACFSSPIFSSVGKVLGAFALYFHEARGPTRVEQSVVEGCVPLAMIALERHERVMERQRLAFTDTLTGLPNRAKFNHDLERMESGPGWSLLLIDLDRLKLVNDTFGHAAGDEIICTVAARLAEVSQPFLVYRLGGDEFAIILDIEDRKQLEGLVASFASSVRVPADCDGNTVIPTVTMGIALSADARTLPELRHNADIALYHAKETSRGGFIIYDAAVNTSMSRRLTAIQKVASALKENKIEAWYQPIVQIDTGEVVGVEALARLTRSDGSIIPATEFHDAINDFRVAQELSCVMLEHIARDYGSWRQQGHELRYLGFNLSAADLSSTDFSKKLIKTFEEHKISPDCGVLEVSETICVGGRDEGASKHIAALRGQGFRIAIDDFGTGPASLAHLLSAPADVIKIDQSWIARLAPNSSMNFLVEALLHVCNGLGVAVIAEGIETKQQAELLLRQGCILGQGLFCAGPLPQKRIASFIQEHRPARRLLDTSCDLRVRRNAPVSRKLQGAG